jgi:3-oxoacyl-(acyl-carrier-protein) synthase
VSFTVTARASARRFAYQHASLLNALDQGMSLIAAGMADVRIADGDGLAHSPAELYQRMFSDESALSTRNGEQPTKDAALAA